VGWWRALGDRLNEAAYRLAYLGDPAAVPWERGELDPVIAAYLGRLGLPVGASVLDAGCGLGTQTLALARLGWAAEGIDFQPRAVAVATRRAADAGLACAFERADVLEPRARGPYALVLDRGCFHSLPAASRPRYVQNLARWVAPGGHLLLRCFVVEGWRARLRPTLIPAIPLPDVYAALAPSFVAQDLEISPPERFLWPRMATLWLRRAPESGRALV
jgi:SAM-dependent methyltransferase